MKNRYYISLFLLCVALSSCDLFCKNKGCSKNPDNIVSKVRRVNVFDLRATSPYQGQSVAIFEFTQDIIHYEPENSCSICYDANKYLVKLKIINLIPNKRLKFDYDVTFRLNYAAWNNQNVVTIEPGATIDQGVISTSGADITMGSILILSRSGADYLSIIYEDG